jgi:hypothetical protein
VFPARYEMSSYIVFRKRLVSKRLNGGGRIFRASELDIACFSLLVPL